MEFYEFFTYTGGVDVKGKLREWEDDIISIDLVFPLTAGPLLQFGSINWKAVKIARPRLRSSPFIGVPM